MVLALWSQLGLLACKVPFRGMKLPELCRWFYYGGSRCPDLKSCHPSCGGACSPISALWSPNAYGRSAYWVYCSIGCSQIHGIWEDTDTCLIISSAKSVILSLFDVKM